MGRLWKRLPSEAMDTSSLEKFKSCLDGALWEVSLLMSGGLDVGELFFT